MEIKSCFFSLYEMSDEMKNSEAAYLAGLAGKFGRLQLAEEGTNVVLHAYDGDVQAHCLYMRTAGGYLTEEFSRAARQQQVIQFFFIYYSVSCYMFIYLMTLNKRQLYTYNFKFETNITYIIS